jgi:hypothetical protein
MIANRGIHWAIEHRGIGALTDWRIAALPHCFNRMPQCTNPNQLPNESPDWQSSIAQ